MKIFPSLASAIIFLLQTGCGAGDQPGLKFAPLTSGDQPDESYVRAPEKPFERSDRLFNFEQLTTFYDVPGEFGYFMLGAEYGFESLSVIVTETQPQGGPPLHTHSVEEAHILLSGEVAYVIGDKTFRAAGPYIAKIPAGTPHTFANVGQQPLNLIGVLPSSSPDYAELGPNPLLGE